MNKYAIDGFNDIHYNELKVYDFIKDIIENTMESYGYRQVLTPSFESYDMYNIDGAFPRDKMFKLIGNDGKVLVLRPDATIPIARMAASRYRNSQEVLKFGYITNIFRDSSSTTDFRKEFMQAGIEYMGNSLPDCDGEIIALSINILKELGIKKIHIDMGNVTFLNGLFDEIQIEVIERVKILSYIENKNIGELKAYLDSIEVSKEISQILCHVPMLFGKFKDTVNQAKKLCINQKMTAALNTMEETYEIINSYGYEDYIFIDLGFTNQFNYYSGLIFKGYINGIGEAILSGGRYDTLSSTFGVNRPASGFGINISLLMDTLINRSDEKDDYNILFLYDDNKRRESLNLARKLRSQGIIVDYIHSSLEEGIKKENYKYILKCIDNSFELSTKTDKQLLREEEILTKLKEAKLCI